MDRLASLVRENKIAMCICWIIIICVGFIFFSNVFSQLITPIKLVWVCCVSLVVYWAIVFTLIYFESNNKLKWISSISDQFIHMQIFLDNNVIIIEILEGEMERLEQLGRARNFKIEKVAEYNGIVKLVVK